MALPSSLEQAVDVGELPGFSAGLVSIQDAAAQLGAQLVAPHPGQRVLDACAAPGGKTCHLLELEPELGELVAVDVSRERLQRVEENLGRLGLEATLIAGDAAEPNWWDGRPFDRILLDVPCSATGVIRRHPDIKLLRRPEDVPQLADRQLHLLSSAWKLLASGGELTYASCSALRAETIGIGNKYSNQRSYSMDCFGAQLILSAYFFVYVKHRSVNAHLSNVHATIRIAPPSKFDGIKCFFIKFHSAKTFLL